MMKRILPIAVLAALVTIAPAQGFGGGQGRAAMLQSKTMAQLSLLSRTDVQEELKLDDAQKAKLDALKAGGRDRIRTAMMGLSRDSEPSEMQAKFQSVMDDLSKEAFGNLTEDQKKRLNELSIQSSGANALLQPDVVAALAITPAQKAKMDDLDRMQNEANEGLIDRFREEEISREELQTKMQGNRKALEGAKMKILTEKQLAKLKELGGKPFEFKNPKPGTTPFGRPGG